MNREQAKELLPAITHFANGGNLWYRLNAINEWYKQEVLYITDTKYIQNIIEDKHFEARKAFALGKEIEKRIKYQDDTNGQWDVTHYPTWNNISYEYRPKPKEVYDYQFTFKRGEEWYMSIERWQGVKEAMHFITGEDITRFDPSKRLRE